MDTAENKEISGSVKDIADIASVDDDDDNQSISAASTASRYYFIKLLKIQIMTKSLNL